MLFAFPQSPSSKGKIVEWCRRETQTCFTTWDLEDVCSVRMLLVSDIYLNVLPPYSDSSFLKLSQGLSSKSGYSFSWETLTVTTKQRGGLQKRRNLDKTCILSSAKKVKKKKKIYPNICISDWLYLWAVGKTVCVSACVWRETNFFRIALTKCIYDWPEMTRNHILIICIGRFCRRINLYLNHKWRSNCTLKTFCHFNSPTCFNFQLKSFFIPSVLDSLIFFLFSIEIHLWFWKIPFCFRVSHVQF